MRAAFARFLLLVASGCSGDLWQVQEACQQPVNNRSARMAPGGSYWFHTEKLINCARWLHMSNDQAW